MEQRIISSLQIMSNINNEQYDSDKKSRILKKCLFSLMKDDVYDDIRYEDEYADWEPQDIPLREIQLENDLFSRAKVILKRIELYKKFPDMRLDNCEYKIKKQIKNIYNVDAKLNFICDILRKCYIPEKYTVATNDDGCNDLHYAIMSRQDKQMIIQINKENPEYKYQKNNSGYTPIDMLNLLNNSIKLT